MARPLTRDGGFVRYNQDVLLQRRLVITVADPVVRFRNLVMKPNLLDFEMRNARVAWERSRATFSSKIEGPHFDDLAREWARRHASEAGLDDIGQVGTTVVSCKEHRGHEVDVVALNRGSLPRRKNASIALLGEAKHSSKPRDISELHRLEHVAALLGERGWDTASTAYVIFSRSGFTDEIKAAVSGRLRLLELGDLYGIAGGHASSIAVSLGVVELGNGVASRSDRSSTCAAGAATAGCAPADRQGAVFRCYAPDSREDDDAARADP
jgi:hypothetical protein